jgi:hypothetical protein
MTEITYLLPIIGVLETTIYNDGQMDGWMGRALLWLWLCR